jgi:hypothetical protein
MKFLMPVLVAAAFMMASKAECNNAQRDANTIKANTEANSYEPQSTMPDKTGSTSLTGQDRSHAQTMNRQGTFTDPTVQGMKDADQAAELSQPAANIDLNKYPYNKRMQFRNAMNDRLGQIEERLGSARRRSNDKAEIKSIEQQRKVAEKNLHQVNKVDQAHWENYKSEFRDQVARLERSVDTLATARK